MTAKQKGTTILSITILSIIPFRTTVSGTRESLLKGKGQLLDLLVLTSLDQLLLILENFLLF
jgi:hypothetical protein